LAVVVVDVFVHVDILVAWKGFLLACASEVVVDTKRCLHENVFAVAIFVRFLPESSIDVDVAESQILAVVALVDQELFVVDDSEAGVVVAVLCMPCLWYCCFRGKVLALTAGLSCPVPAGSPCCVVFVVAAGSSYPVSGSPYPAAGSWLRPPW